MSCYARRTMNNYEIIWSSRFGGQGTRTVHGAALADAWVNELRDKGVIVTTLCPGPTRTEFQSRAGMHASKLFSGPNVMDARSVAEIGFRAMMAGKSLVVAGRLNALMVFLTRFAPRQLAASMARKLAEHA